MKNTPTIYPLRYCTGGCASPGHESHLYSVDPVDGILSAIHLCPGNAGRPVMECLEDGEPTGDGFFAPESENDTPHPLYLAALQSDETYSQTISTQFPGKTRWTLTAEENAHPEIDAAYRAKVKADRTWLDTMRADVPLHEAEKPKGMTMDEMKAHLAQRATEGACGLSWDEIEWKQGGNLRR